MGVSAVNNFYLNPSRTAKIKGTESKEKPVGTDKKSAKISADIGKISTTRAAGYIAATAIGAAAIGGLLVSKGRHWRIRQLQERISELITKNETAEKSLKNYQKSVEVLIDGAFSPEEVKAKILDNFRRKLSEPLNYNPSIPPVLNRNTKKLPPDAIALPERFTPTKNRINMTEIKIPEFKPGQRFDFELPMSCEVKITKEANGKFTPQSLHETTITETYADSVIWDNDKVARDILQNFYDGHGQTLDGVKMSFAPLQNGKYKVRIEGKSTYTPDKAILLGESSKQNDNKAAGNFGEGLKMTVLKILKDSGAESFNVGSDDWKVTWQFISGKLNNKRVLGYKLDKVDKFDGNYIEFETNNRTLLRSLRKTINRFYHSHNTDFKCPDYENGLIGIKILPKDEPGAFYIAGQRYQVADSYEGLKGLTVFLKEKPPAKKGDTIVFDPSRDRTSLNSAHLKSIAKYIAEDPNISKQELVKIIHSLENFWAVSERYNPNEYNFLEGILSGASTRDLHIKFPDKYVARTFYDSLEMLQSLEESGYVVCSRSFSDIGMPNVSDLLNTIRKHKPLNPTDIQKQKLILIKEGVNTFKPYLENKYFKPEELDTKIYIFNREASDESRYYEYTTAEAILDYDHSGETLSKGFWINKDYLDRGSFTEILGTALHELCHKYGGDESSSFSYKLTEIMKELISSGMNDAKGRTQLQQLQKLWDELPKNC